MENPHTELALIQKKLHLADYLLQANYIYKSLTNLQAAAAEEKTL